MTSSERLGQRLFLLGDDAGSVNLMKLAGNVLTALTLQGMGEALALLGKGCLTPQDLRATIASDRAQKLLTRPIREHDASPSPQGVGCTSHQRMIATSSVMNDFMAPR